MESQNPSSLIPHPDPGSRIPIPDPGSRNPGSRIPDPGRYASIDDLVARVRLRRDELATLADIGALNAFGHHRRSALWQIERAVRPAGELFERTDDSNSDPVAFSMLAGPHLLALGARLSRASPSATPTRSPRCGPGASREPQALPIRIPIPIPTLR